MDGTKSREPDPSAAGRPQSGEPGLLPTGLTARRRYSPGQRVYLDQLKQGSYNSYAGGLLFNPLLNLGKEWHGRGWSAFRCIPKSESAGRPARSGYWMSSPLSRGTGNSKPVVRSSSSSRSSANSKGRFSTSCGCRISCFRPPPDCVARYGVPKVRKVSLVGRGGWFVLDHQTVVPLCPNPPDAAIGQNAPDSLASGPWPGLPGEAPRPVAASRQTAVPLLQSGLDNLAGPPATVLR